MAAVNKAILIGHLGKDPKGTATKSGGRVVSFSLATSERWKDKASGETRERTQWHQIVIFNEALGKVAEVHLRKGSRVYIEGSIETRKWADQAGVDRYLTEIVLRPYRGELTLIEAQTRPSPDPDAYGVTRAGEPAAASGPAAGAQGFETDDDIPF